jgi:hypothetical protein
MRDWQIAYLGRRTFPADLTDGGAEEAYSLGPEFGLLGIIPAALTA